MRVRMRAKRDTFARMSTLSFGLGNRPRPWLAAAAIASGVTTLVCLPFAPGLFGLLGLLLTAGTVLLGGLAFWVALPQVLVSHWSQRSSRRRCSRSHSRGNWHCSRSLR